MSIYARFMAFGLGKQHKYLLYASSQGGNISFGLLRVAILVFLCGGSHYTGLGAAILFCSSTALLWISDYMDIGLPFCFTSLLRISSSMA